MEGQIVSVSFKRMISLPGYQNMEATVSVTAPVPADLRADECAESWLACVTELVLEHLRAQVKGMYENTGLCLGDYRRLMQCLLVPMEELPKAMPLVSEELDFGDETEADYEDEYDEE